MPKPKATKIKRERREEGTIVDVRLRLDPERKQEIDAKVKELRLSGHSELFRCLWDRWGRYTSREDFAARGQRDEAAA